MESVYVIYIQSNKKRQLVKLPENEISWTFGHAWSIAVGIQKQNVTVIHYDKCQRFTHGHLSSKSLVREMHRITQGNRMS